MIDRKGCDELTHVFVVAAYGSSPYLRRCLESVLVQRGAGNSVHLTTSTPAPDVVSLCEELGVGLTINPTRGGIGADWNFALRAVDADLVTIAHQDDIYLPDYSCMIKECAARQCAAFYFTNHWECDESGTRRAGINVKIKRVLSSLASSDGLVKTPFQRWRLFAFGNPVSCPSVTFSSGALRDFSFAEDFGSNLDWDAWHRLLAVAPAAYIDTPLVVHSVHSGTETTAAIGDGRRTAEDLRMFKRFWPAPIASAMAFFYRLSYLSNSR